MCKLAGGRWKSFHWLINSFTRILLGWNLNLVQRRHRVVMILHKRPPIVLSLWHV